MVRDTAHTEAATSRNLVLVAAAKWACRPQCYQYVAVRNKVIAIYGSPFSFRSAN